MLGVVRADRFLWGRQYLRDIVPELTTRVQALIRRLWSYVLPDPWKAQTATQLPVRTFGALR